MTIRIIIADDHRIIRDGLCSLLQKEPDIEVIAQVEDGHEAVELACKLLPAIVIMDIGMPGLNGIEATRQIVAAEPGIRVIALSMHAERRFVAEMLKAGASGYLLKDSASEELIRAIHAVLEKGTYLPPSLTTGVVEEYVRGPASSEGGAFSVLTSREREVLQLLAEGRTTKALAADLHVSVQNHRDAQAQHHGKARHPQRCRVDQIRHSRRINFARTINHVSVSSHLLLSS